MTAIDLATVLAEERRIMNFYAPHYDTATLTNAYVYRIARAQFVDWIAATLREAGRDLEQLTVLEAGSGTGSVTDLMSQARFGHLTGIDLAEGMLREARKRRVPRADWARALIEHPPFRREVFDVVFACFSLHHLYEPRAFFELVDRTLRPGGWFFVLEYDADSGLGGASDGAVHRRLGDLLRRLFALKNRRTLAARPALALLQNPAHRQLGSAIIRQAMPRPEDYDIRREPRGLLLPALLPVLVEESGFDRIVARCANAVDRRLEQRFGGLFQWIAGRRRRSEE